MAKRKSWEKRHFFLVMVGVAIVAFIIYFYPGRTDDTSTINVPQPSTITGNMPIPSANEVHYESDGMATP